MDILRTLADNPALLEATKKAILDEFSLVEGMVDSDRSDIQLGQMFRARLVGIQNVENAFKKILRFKSREEDKSVGVNRAR